MSCSKQWSPVMPFWSYYWFVWRHLASGYELQGSRNGTCLADQSWSEGDPICVVLNCSTSPPLDNSLLQLPCDAQYQSTCTTVCVDGFTGGGGSYTCVVTDAATNSVGWNGTTSCQRGKT